ncbi:hypothetical protein BP6252_05656 [Coleophoma cylindrospora]|uniref:Uncharacterized protein n=1 Tax=Coleophoma cylindrospora TaxID=1849047 RepID=A0A3D8RU76_9HELO|nr:hypothetical protein BP6252_05656 [Coleophoma cylindrospora]
MCCRGRNAGRFRRRRRGGLIAMIVDHLRKKHGQSIADEAATATTKQESGAEEVFEESWSGAAVEPVAALKQQTGAEEEFEESWGGAAAGPIMQDVQSGHDDHWAGKSPPPVYEAREGYGRDKAGWVEVRVGRKEVGKADN